MAVVITYGTFDMFHVGHLRLLERLARLGTSLIVGVSTDEFNDIKGKKSVFSFQDRATIVGALKCVSRVIPENDWTQKRMDIGTYNVDILGMGDDWIGRFDHLSDVCSVVYLPRTPIVSSTEIKMKCKSGESFEVQIISDAQEA